MIRTAAAAFHANHAAWPSGLPGPVGRERAGLAEAAWWIVLPQGEWGMSVRQFNYAVLYGLVYRVPLMDNQP